MEGVPFFNNPLARSVFISVSIWQSSTSIFKMKAAVMDYSCYSCHDAINWIMKSWIIHDVKNWIITFSWRHIGVPRINLHTNRWRHRALLLSLPFQNEHDSQEIRITRLSVAVPRLKPCDAFLQSLLLSVFRWESFNLHVSWRWVCDRIHISWSVSCQSGWVQA